MFKRKIILASKSPRRKQLLKQAGFDFEVKSKPVVETYPADLPVEDIATFLARKKANASKSLIKDDHILLAADSIVILGNSIYGKPDDREDAIKILQQLSGKIHKVITGVCLMSAEKSTSFSCISKVYMDELTQEEIIYYVDNYEPYDKAGAYAIQEWIGLCKISRIEGTYSNIMGLPVEALYKELNKF